MTRETSLSLLNRLRCSPEPDCWNRLVQLYTPLIRRWLRNFNVQDTDADDLVQEVLFAVSKDLSQFEHSGQRGAFRAWLKTILVNRLRNFWRARDRRRQAMGECHINERLSDLANPNSDLSLLWNQEHDQYVLRQLLEMVEHQFAPTTWAAFRRVALEGEAPADVAATLQISLNAVVIAKSRVLSSLRQEAEGLLDSSGGFPTNC